MAVEEFGHGAPVLVLHGFTGTAASMAPVSVALAGDHRVLAPDLVGHGGSEAPGGTEPYTMASIVQQLVVLLDHLGEPDPVGLVGYSMGARIALAFAVAHPERVAWLVTIGGTAGLDGEAEAEQRRAADAALADEIENDGIESFVDRWEALPIFATQRSLPRAKRDEIRTARLGQRPHGLANSLRGVGTGSMPSLWPLLGGLAAPTLLIAGQHDAKFIELAAAMHERLPISEVAVVAGAGHAAHIEAPEATVREIVRFVAATEAGGPPGPRRGAVTAMLEPFRAKLRQPVATARGDITEREGVVVCLTDQDGRVGRGEVSPLPGWSAVTAAEAVGQLQQWVDGDRSPARMSQFAPEVRAGIEVAQLSLDAECSGRPLWAYLGGTSAQVPVNALIGGADPDALALATEHALSAGFTTLKTKVGLADDAARLARLADVVPPGVSVRVDANGAWSVDEAVEWVDRITTLLGDRLEYIEDPVADLAAQRALVAEVGGRFAVDELVRGSAELAQVIDEQLADVLVVKAPLLGGISAVRALAAQATDAGVDVVVSSLHDGPVGLAAWAALASALGGSRAHGLGTASLLDHPAMAALEVRGGVLELPG